MHEKTVNWITGGEIIGGFYASNPTDSVTAAKYPWGWKELDYDDGHWQIPEVIFSQPKTDAGAGHGWILQPRTTAIQVSKKETLTRIARSDIKDLEKDFQFGNESLKIKANTQAKIPIDQGYVTLGYSKLILSNGNNARIKVQYSEALYNSSNQKGNRNNLEGKVIKGISDVYVMDGGINRTYQPIWFRTFRFIQLEIKTRREPLIIEDFYNVYSATNFPVNTSLNTDNPIYDKVWDLCWHSMKICAQDNLISDAYYEQMKYVGDLRPHLKGWTALTGDLTYFKSALEQFNNSRLPDGNITSCYPLKATFVHPTYSLIWIDMLYDLMMLEGNNKFLKQYTGEIEEVFEFYESIINKNVLVGNSKYRMFIDWYVPKGGNSPVNKNSNSVILILNYAYTLKNAAKTFDWLGYREKASRYRNQSQKYAEIVKKLCFNEERGFYADDPGHTFFDQRASILVILCDAHSTEELKKLMKQVLSTNTKFDSKANLFYYFYLFEAMQKTGVGNFTEQLSPWIAMLELGMTGTPEKRVEQHPRSEVHPWTAHPVHYYFGVVAGIKPTKPGFSSVDISPNPGNLKKVNASLPTKKGKITFDYMLTTNDNIQGKIILPENMKGTFNWQGKTVELKPGIINF